MKQVLSLIFILFFLGFQSQEIVDKEAFKKCRKEFNKKICLSDEDKDNILFYLDKCPKEFGSEENNGCPWPDLDGDGVFDKDDACPNVAGPKENKGCPWPDTDGDGILDKDDACPEMFGEIEYQGCPSPKIDCTKFYEDERLKLEKFKIDYKDIQNIYNLLSINIIDYFKKENKNIEIGQIYVGFLDYGPQCGTHPNRCYSSRSIEEYNFLITKFWNKEILENIVNRKKTILYIRYNFRIPDSEILMVVPEKTHNYFLKNKFNESMVIIKPKTAKNSKNKISGSVVINFVNPYLLSITYTPMTGPSELRKKFEYKDGKWIEIKKEIND